MNIVRNSIASSVLFAFAAAGCAGADESGQFGEGEALEKGVQGADQVPDLFDFAPDTGVREKSAESDLSGKGAVNVTLGTTFVQSVTIPAFGTVTYETSNRVNVDPVLALIIRTNPWNGWFDAGTAVGQATTLGFDDDSAGNYNSRIVYTNPDGAARQAFLIAFSYDSTIPGGSGTVDINGFGTVQVRAGSARFSSNQGWIGTSASSGDPWLTAISPTIGNGNSRWNDDNPAGPAGNRESRINGFTNQFIWVVGHAYNGSGTTTINF